MRDTIAIFTHLANDLHADLVRAELSRRGEKVVVLDPKDIALGRLSIDIRAAGADASIWTHECGEVLIGRLKSALYRRPQSVVEDERVDPIYRPLVREEWSHAIESLWRISKDDCNWVSNPADIRAADNKPFQLQLAVRMGFHVPRTLISNQHEKLVEFFTGAPFIVKKLRSHGVVTEQKLALFVSKLFNSPDEIAAFDLSLCPMIFQDFVDKTFDLRVTVVDGEVFAVKIDSQRDASTRVDYRVVQGKLLNVPHETYHLPHKIAAACRRMTNALNLKFAAFDFAVDRDGKHWFLEVNPNGQWLWLQLLTNTPILQRLCDLLGRPASLPAATRSQPRPDGRPAASRAGP